MNDCCEVKQLSNVLVQENGIIRDEGGTIIARLVDSADFKSLPIREEGMMNELEALIQRIDKLEEEYGVGTKVCVWDLKDNIPVASCRPQTVISKTLASYNPFFSYCPFCGERIEVINE